MQPSHADFGPRTRWSLVNAFTEVLRPDCRSNPQAFAGRTSRLSALLEPPDEGPTDLEAASREDDIESQEHEARQDAEGLPSVRDPAEPEAVTPASDRAAADEFWSSYEAGY